MLFKMNDLTWLEIDLRKIKNNIAGLRSYIRAESKIMAVLKNDAFGHGLVEVAKYIENLAIDYFGVGTIQEALILRKKKITKPILVLGYTDPDFFENAIANEIELAVWDKDAIRQISKAGMRAKKPAKVHLKIDTGLNRYGIDKKDAMEYITYIAHQPKVHISGIFSQFASAENRDKSYAFKQLGSFQEVINSVEREGFENILKHIANSAAALSITSSQFDMVRLGITIYGLFPSAQLGNFFELEPALSWKTKIVQIKKIAGSEKVGFGAEYQTSAPTYLATIPVGYGYGYDKRLSNLSKVLINGKRAPVIGKISMDTLTVDISNLEDTKINDEVVLIGKQGTENITAGELAGYLDTTNYEIVTRINANIKRKYLK